MTKPMSIRIVNTVRSYSTRTKQSLSLPDGRTLSYAEYGIPSGTPLLYLHGFPSSRLEASAFDPIARSRNLRIIAPERPGYGQSTFQPNRQIRDYPADIQSLADHLNLPSFAVLGGSGGGPYALACAHSLPHHRLSGVGVLAGAGPWSAGMQYVSVSRRLTSLAATHTPVGFRLVLDGLVNALKWTVTTRPATRWINAWLEKQASSEKGTLSIDERRQMVLDMSFEAFAQGSGATVQEAVLLSHDWGFRFEDIAYDKVRIWHGVNDSNAPVEMIRYMAGRIPHCALTEFDDTHYTVARHIERILDELVPVA
ncbi:hypothetical protein ASPVEDRAFT_31646 [Aspergillus versicolor CBS 583.65]|uniref:AB hydrolase-1 domain-containing protein n=1 Tax=Aspergillus versicolor CBS 583.65 TaxID=1036611 RepID=A0A1L9PUQ6_ASPVE|nr:uncharacterized protein ASPVEDRAFT_31646 [Aspergillus versicolor CBS 583.65]OJJ05251.1 hypothetical protein ASPVEDRAFT_31646 [Aspergillus versicolor CBS 583.65]